MCIGDLESQEPGGKAVMVPSPFVLGELSVTEHFVSFSGCPQTLQQAEVNAGMIVHLLPQSIRRASSVHSTASACLLPM